MAIDPNVLQLVGAAMQSGQQRKMFEAELAQRSEQFKAQQAMAQLASDRQYNLSNRELGMQERLSSLQAAYQKQQDEYARQNQRMETLMKMMQLRSLTDNERLTRQGDIAKAKDNATFVDNQLDMDSATNQFNTHITELNDTDREGNKLDSTTMEFFNAAFPAVAGVTGAAFGGTIGALGGPLASIGLGSVTSAGSTAIANALSSKDLTKSLKNKKLALAFVQQFKANPELLTTMDKKSFASNEGARALKELDPNTYTELESLVNMYYTAKAANLRTNAGLGAHTSTYLNNLPQQNYPEIDQMYELFGLAPQ